MVVDLVQLALALLILYFLLAEQMHVGTILKDSLTAISAS